MGSAVKLSDELVASARHESEIYSRSMTQQIEHWARIGRAVERTGQIGEDRIRAALRAELAFDALGTDEKLRYFSELEYRVHAPAGDKDLARRLAAEEG